MLPAGDVSIGIKCAPGVVGPAEADIDFDIIKNDNDTFTVKYTPPGPGQYTIMVLFADQVRVQTGKLLLTHFLFYLRTPVTLTSHSTVTSHVSLLRGRRLTV